MSKRKTMAEERRANVLAMKARSSRILFSGLFLLTACGGRIDGSPGDTDREPSRASPPSTGGAPAPGGGAEATSACESPRGMETIANLGEEGVATAGRIVVDERFLYIDTNRGTFRVRKCGGPAVLLASNEAGQYTASGFVQDSSFLYLASNAPLKGGFVKRIAKAGGSVEELASAREAHGLALAPADTHGPARLYWIDKTGAGGNLRLTRLDDRSTTTVASVPVALSYGPFLADGTGVTFFVTGASNYGTFYVHRWSGISMLGGAASPFELVAGAAHDGQTKTELYFTFGHTGRNGVGRLTRAVASPAELTAEAKAPFGLAQRAGVLYWSDMSTGTVSRCPISPDTSRCEVAPEVFATGEDDPRYVVTDEDSVFWATRRGVVKRAPLR